MILGLLFGYVFAWSGSLWIPIILHFIFNGISVVAAFLFQRGTIDVDVESLGTTHNNLIIILSFAVTLILFVLIYRFKNNTFENIEDDCDIITQ